MAELEKLIELARKVKMSADEREAQRRSFAYGNAGFENENITRAMIRDQAEKLENEK